MSENPQAGSPAMAERDPATGWFEFELHFRLSQFLWHEAQLLDEHRFSDWLALFEDEFSYRMPVHRNTLRKRRGADTPVHAPIEMAHYDDDRALMAMRVAQLESGQNWAEEPRSLSRHFITNIRVQPDAANHGLYDVRSNFFVTRSRGETEQDYWAGERFDKIRRHAAGFRIASRLVVLDQNVVLSKNLSIFF